MNLKEIKWKSFSFPDIFEIKGGFYNKKPEANAVGNVPFIGATDSNNGITQFNTYDGIDMTSKTGDDNNAPIEKKIFNGNCIVVTNNGSVGYAYYQVSDFTCSHDVNPLYLRERKLTPNLAYFLIGAIEKQRVCFTYVHKWRPMRMRKSKILLPILEDGKPDYEFMEQYTNNIQSKKRYKYLKYCKMQLDVLSTEKEIKSKEKIIWKDFFISILFEKPQRGKRIVEKNHIAGDTPLVSSYGQGNGVTNFIGNEEKVKKFTDCISIANGGSSAGKAFYHPYTFIAADHVTQCWNKNLNKYQYLFLATVMTKALTGKYSFSHEISDPRLAKERIMLPTTESGEPDYEYMEQYIKNLMIKKYKSYLDYVEK